MNTENSIRIPAMRRSDRFLVIGAALVMGCMVGSLPALSADSDGNFGTRGVGSDRCGALLERLEQSPEIVLPTVSWLMGYVTAVNRLQNDTFDISPILDGAALFELTVATCDANPDITYEGAVFEVLGALSLARVRTQSPVVSMNTDNAATQVRRETLLLVQERLRDLGYSAGVPDGVYGPQTRSAIQAFQAASGLDESGIADPSTLLRLLVQPVQEEEDSAGE